MDHSEPKNTLRPEKRRDQARSSLTATLYRAAATAARPPTAKKFPTTFEMQRYQLPSVGMEQDKDENTDIAQPTRPKPIHSIDRRRVMSLLRSNEILDVKAVQQNANCVSLSTANSDEVIVRIAIPKAIHHGYWESGSSPTSSASSVLESLLTMDKERPSTDSTPKIPSLRAKIATKTDLAHLMDAHPMPQIVYARWWTKFRWQLCSTYMRLWGLVIIANVIALSIMVSRSAMTPRSVSYAAAATAAGANLFAAGLTRHEHFVNLIFRMAISVPVRAPLVTRRIAAKVYAYGGVHSGTGISALLWYFYYTALLVNQFEGSTAMSIALTASTTATLLILVLLVSSAHPGVRRRWHNQWEMFHRFGGWTTVLLVWAQTLIIVVSEASRAERPFATVLAKTPTFYFLVFITCLLVYPWLRMRRRKMTAERLSSHATRLHFHDNTRLATCVGFRLSHNPLIENHGFAAIPNAENEKGFSIVVSNAGDWTKRMINNAPQYIWTKGAPVTGVLRIASLFAPIVIVATGSGIGPCLSFLQVYSDWPMRILWSARAPLDTYGADIVNAVLKADENAIIVDTKVTGHPDLPALIYALYEETNAEAIAIISNPTVTRKVVFEMEARKVPAFGAIFDS